jgi:2-methylcitrate dehydratase PrpD
MIGQKLDPTVRSSSYVSGAGLAAIAAIAPDALYDVERAKALSDRRIMELAEKGQVVADPALDSLYPKQWPAKLEVTTNSGTVRQMMSDPLGAPGNPMADADLENKMRRLLAQMGLVHVLEPLLVATGRPFESDGAALALARFFTEGGPSLPSATP